MKEVIDPNDSLGAERYQHERHFARRCALQYLYQMDIQGDWGNLARNLAMLRRQVLDLDETGDETLVNRAWAFAETLVRGVVEHRELLDEKIGACATNWTVARMSAIDRNILRLAAYQLAFRDDVPPLTAVDEGVELAKEFGHADSSRFVNGVLDRLLKDQPRRGEESE